MPSTILAVSPREQMRSQLVDAMRMQGLRCVTATDPGTALDAVHSYDPSLALVDLTLSGQQAHDLVRRLRGLNNLPTIALAEHADETEEAIAFAVGVDDFVVWPGSPRVLAARINALLRRTVTREHGEIRPCVLSFQGVTADLESHALFVNGVEVHLTRTEFDLLVLLLQNPTQVIRRDDIVSKVWGHWPGDDHIIEVHLSRLRNKISAAGGPSIAEAVRGVGYRLAHPNRTRQPHHSERGLSVVI